MICEFCSLPIEPVDGPGVKYSHRHVESKRISCWDVYKPEIATPAPAPVVAAAQPEGI